MLPVSVTRDGYLVAVVVGASSATARATSAPEARRAEALCRWWAERGCPSAAGARPWRSAVELVEHIAAEMGAADAAQARRRFTRIFGRAA